MRSYFRYWHEAFRLPSWSEQRVVDTVVTTNEQPLRDGFGRGAGAIVALPHMANWDLAGAWACLTGMPVTTVAERLRPESLYDRFVGYREQLGMEVIALTGAGNPLGLLRGRVAAGPAGLPARRPRPDGLGRGGRPAGGAGPAAGRSGRPRPDDRCAVGGGEPALRRGPLLRIDFSDPVPTVSGAGRRGSDDAAGGRLVHRAGSAQHPEDWHMLQRVFTADRAVRRRPARSGR